MWLVLGLYHGDSHTQRSWCAGQVSKDGQGVPRVAMGVPRDTMGVLGVAMDVPVGWS